MADNSNNSSNSIDASQLPFFDSTPGTTPQEQASIELEEAKRNKEKEEKARKRTNRRRNRTKKEKKLQGIYALPVYAATYKCYMECRFRFRKLPNDVKGEGKDIRRLLLEVLIDIELVYRQLYPYSALPYIMKLMMFPVTMIRGLRDSRDISRHDFAILCEHTGAMIKNMRAWNDFYNPDKHLDISSLDNMAHDNHMPPDILLRGFADDNPNSSGPAAATDKK